LNNYQLVGESLWPKQGEEMPTSIDTAFTVHDEAPPITLSLTQAHFPDSTCTQYCDV
jgi:hypothetical protein